MRAPRHGRLSLGRDLTGSYVEVLLWLLIVPLGVAILGLVARAPEAVTAD